MELPAIVRPAGSGDVEEEADLLIEAVLENDLRVGLDPVARARGYRRLLESGLTVKGVAERLATTQARVREHVRILKLSEPAQAKLEAGEVPLRAVKPLEALTRIHPGLAATAIGQVLDAGEDGYEPYTWADLERDPLAVATAGELPEGVYRAYASYPLDAFTLSEQALKDLAALEKLIDTKVTVVRFEHDELEQARQLGAAHGEHSQPIIVGADIAGQLAGNYLARCVKVQRANQRRARDQQPSQTGHQHVGVDGAQASEEARRAQRQADREARERAVAFNLELGRVIYTNLVRVKVDERTLKLVSSVNVTGELGELAMRGARYGFPGWVQEVTQANDNTKLGYIDQRAEAQQRAGEFLAGASTAGEIAGRQLALLAMAVYADQQAVAASNRSWHNVTSSGPWAQQVDELLDELVTDKLPTAAIALIANVLGERKQQREQKLADQQARQDALARLEGIEQRIAELDAEDLARVQEDLDVAWTGWDPRQGELRQLLRARQKTLAAHGND